ncbi:hypothetical protein BJ912DRAFT_1020885 [Pholiota molesta]|nr:hypothetical protein BJ912DRAFT_1020885 [Pholiota molesta]
MALNVLSIGGSRNIGYFSSVKLLQGGANVTFLLRSPATFDSDDTIQNTAIFNSPVDVLLFTVGGTPKFSITHGMVITPAALVTESLFNALTTMPRTTPEPGLDKVGAERLISHCTGWAWNTEEDGEPAEDIMGANWQDTPGLPEAGSLKRVLVVRPALLTDGDCRAEEAGGKGPLIVKDVAHFVADAILFRWDEFENKRVSIVY